MNIFDRDIQYLKGIGEKRAKLYKRLSINTVNDLIHYYPRSYLDFSSVKNISETIPGEVCCIKATITEPARVSMVRRGMTLYKFKAADKTAVCGITFFNNKYITDMLKEGHTYYFYGKIGGSLFRRELTSPEFLSSSEDNSMQPVYPLTSGLSSRSIAAEVKLALSLCEENITDPLPDSIRRKYSLCHITYALQNIHFPKDKATLETARRRLIFEELLTLSLGMALLRHRNQSYDADPCKPADMNIFYDKLPFEPTGAQKRAIEDGLRDMAAQTPMNRLIEGDVGSGKTVVAAALCFNAAQNSLQSALMAPTEILAQQHFLTLSRLLSPCGISVGLLTGSTPAGERKKILKMLKTRELDVIVGTHALISQNVEFQKLGLVITDEQHRFGVGQRAALASKGRDPHVLVMSATPIPRTLGLIIYGDLDISILDEMPRGRQKVLTYCIDSSKRKRAFNFIKKYLSQGKQAFIVCPLVDDSDTGAQGLAAATAYFEKIKNEDFHDFRVGLLHGKMKPAEKESVMRAFSEGSLDLLVSTTVIEVGVDVPNAVIMVIENAERFGLSQLHQLRGRVGRGDEQSYCILISDANGKQSAGRLRTMCETNDGFKIAEQDLKLRGPGDFFGKRQHGLPELKIADLTNDMQLLRMAKAAADSIISKDPMLKLPEHAGLRAQTEAMFSKEDIAFN
ncbi:ATP-dependent DNA helicase RecG [[Clostridium] cellulosi]